MTFRPVSAARRLMAGMALLSLVASCAALPPVAGMAPGSTAATSTSPDDASLVGQAAADVLQADRELDDYTYLALRALAARSYTVAQAGMPIGGGMLGGGMMAGGAPGSGMMAPGAGIAMMRPDRAMRDRLGQRHGGMMARGQARHAGMTAIADAMAKALEAATWTDNGDGTRTRVVAFTVAADQPAGMPGRDVRMTLTVDTETGALLASKHEATMTFASGARRAMTRDLAVQADGAYKVAMTMTDTEPDASARKTSWNATIAADGTRTGSGTTVWTAADGRVLRTVEHDLAGTFDLPRLDCRMAGLGPLASVSLPWDGAVQQRLRDRTTGALAPV